MTDFIYDAKFDKIPGGPYAWQPLSTVPTLRALLDALQHVTNPRYREHILEEVKRRKQLIPTGTTADEEVSI